MKPQFIFQNAGGLTDSQVVTTGQSGIAPNRLRGFSTVVGIGSCVDGTSNLYSGAAIQVLEWEENGAGGAEQISFRVNGIVSNSGWNNLTIDGTLTLLRTAAVYSNPGGSSEWTWGGGQPNQFGVGGSNHTCVFS